jgi:hypothetical protein
MLWFSVKALAHFFLMSLPKVSEGHWDFVFFKSIFRPDYDQYFSDVADCANGRILKYDARYKFYFNFSGLYFFIREFPVFAQVLRHLYFKPWASLYCFINYLRCVQTIHLFRNLSTRVFVSFGDMQQLDNALIQYLRLNNRCQTMALQHGLYVDSSADPTQINTLNFRNVVAEYFLAWGDVTGELVQSFTNANVVVVGKPSISTSWNSTYDPHANQFLVILDSAALQKYNEKLLNVAQELRLKSGISFRIHPHPDLNASLIEEAQRHSALDRYKFVIGHSTTLLIELASIGVPVFRLKSEVPFHPGLEKIEFTSAKDLLDRSTENLHFKNMIAHLLKFVGSESQHQYKQFFAGQLQR